MATKELPLEKVACDHVFVPPPNAFDKLVTIIVGDGDDSQEFHVHEGVLCYHSTFFQGALRGEFKEAQEGLVHLASEDPFIVKSAIYWMYTNRFWQPGSIEKIPLTKFHIAGLFVFADARGIKELQNASITLLWQKCIQDWSIPFALPYIYDNTTENSALRRFCVDFVVNTFVYKASHNLDDNPQAFLMDVLVRLGELDKAQGLGKKSKSTYIAEKNKDFCRLYHKH